MPQPIVVLGPKPAACAQCGRGPFHGALQLDTPGVVYLHSGECEREWRTNHPEED